MIKTPTDNNIKVYIKTNMMMTQTKIKIMTWHGINNDNVDINMNIIMQH